MSNQKPTAPTAVITDLKSFAFRLFTTKPVIKKEGKLPKSYKIKDTETALNVDMMIKGSGFPINAWLTGELGKLAYEYWTKNNPELVSAGEPVGEGDSAIQYTAFKDMNAFYAFLTSKSVGQGITKEMRLEASKAVANSMKAKKMNPKAITLVSDAVKTLSKAGVYDLYQTKPKTVDNVIKLLEASGHRIVAGNWIEGKNYTPKTMEGAEDLEDLWGSAPVESIEDRDTEEMNKLRQSLK